MMKEIIENVIRNLEEVYSKNVVTNDLVTDLALSYVHIKNHEKALFFGKKGLDFDSTNTFNLYNYASILSVAEPMNFLTVSYYFNKAIKSNPDDLIIKKQYASYLYSRQKYKEQLSLILPLYKIHPNDEEINQHLADAYLALADYQPALNYLEYLYIAQPNSDKAKKQLAFTLLNLNKGDKEQFARGAKLIKDAIFINPNDAESHVVYAYYMMRLGNGSVQQNINGQTEICKTIARKEYLLAKKLDRKIANPDLEKFIK